MKNFTDESVVAKIRQALAGIVEVLEVRADVGGKHVDVRSKSGVRIRIQSGPHRVEASARWFGLPVVVSGLLFLALGAALVYAGFWYIRGPIGKGVGYVGIFLGWFAMMGLRTAFFVWDRVRIVVASLWPPSTKIRSSQ